MIFLIKQETHCRRTYFFLFFFFNQFISLDIYIFFIDLTALHRGQQAERGGAALADRPVVARGTGKRQLPQPGLQDNKIRYI